MSYLVLGVIVMLFVQLGVIWVLACETRMFFTFDGDTYVSELLPPLSGLRKGKLNEEIFAIKVTGLFAMSCIVMFAYAWIWPVLVWRMARA